MASGPTRRLPVLGSGGPGAFGFPTAGGYAPGYGVSFRPFIAYGAVEPFDTSLSLDKRRAWWDKFQYTASSGGWREQELCTRLYSRLSHKTPAPRLGYSTSQSRSAGAGNNSQTAVPVAKTRIPGNAPDLSVEIKCSSHQGQRGFPLRFGCRRHVNQFLKNLRDRELQLSLQGRVYFTTDELEDVLKQVEEMEQGMRRKPANDVPFGRHKPKAWPQAPDDEGLRWEDEDDSGYGYQYDVDNDEAYDGLVDQEEVFRAEAPGGWNERNGRPQNRSDTRGGGGYSRSSQTLSPVPSV
ncbi:hypothetical protein PHMEG_00034429 [Phytophthora megakarya]|uniref:Eukaryotic/viral aspartic protease n=1 Tax=Phytophthora megakarya TaxID=4795 RepID=A0A225URE8_9STRA|nr:hypothetical protein PHMEG_00034429 [Phytophthora megakarya]